jgi:monothiol glutaredoxin
MSANERIESIIGSDRVVLFMKGNRQMPQCGFSASTVGMLDSLMPDYTTVDVLSDQDIRDGIKVFSDWPTIPQLYVDGEFMGGSDIVRDMFNNGDLQKALGLPEPDRTPPEVSISDGAAELIGEALADAGDGAVVHLQISQQFQHDFKLGPASGNEVIAESNGIRIALDLASAPRAKGLELDVTEGFAGKQLTVTNPNAAAPG